MNDDLEVPEAEQELEAPVEAEAEAVEPEVEPEVADEDLALGDLLKREATRQNMRVAAPQHWAAEDKAFLESLPDDAARERALSWRTSLEKGYQTKFEEVAEARKLGDEIEQTFAPLGIPREHRGEAVRRLVAAEQMLRQDPINAVAQLVAGAGVAGPQQAGLFLRQLASAMGVDAGGSAGQAPKNAAEARLAALEQQVLQRERTEQHHHQQQVHQQVQAAQTKLQEFSLAKDASGQALRPHFDRVRATMGSLLQAAAAAGKELDLQGAYDRAIWADPELRAEAQKVETARAAKAAEEARRAGIAKAKGARTPRTASVNVPADASDDVDLGTLLRRTWNEIAA